MTPALFLKADWFLRPFRYNPDWILTSVNGDAMVEAMTVLVLVDHALRHKAQCR